MAQPTLAEIRHFQIHGKYPESLKERIKAEKEAAKKAEETSDEETTSEEEETTEEETSSEEEEVDYPIARAGGWWELSNGKKIRGEDEAKEAQAELELM